MNQHKTKNIVIRKAKVDIGIIPVVNWLNSFNGIHTLFSCEGVEKKKGYEPMVMFFCQDFNSLFCILKAIPNEIGTLELNEYNGCLRYILNFKNKWCLKNFCKTLKIWGY